MSAAFRLDGKVVVLTGAGGIIGSVVVKTLLEAGARVFALDRDDAILARLGARHDSLMLHAADVSDPASLRAAYAALVARWGDADALLNNAVTKTDNFFEPFETFPLRDWDHIMGVNLTGAMLSAQIFGSPMARRGSGSIVNTLSIYGIVGPDQGIYDGSEYLGRKINTPAIYSASKAGLWGLTKYLATYWGHRGVRVNAITPGGVFSGQNETFERNYSRKVPLGRMTSEPDIAHAMQYLCSDASCYVTGHNLVVDGGWTAW
jgi:NAD(P)-dependent dehydrogenase (short-subunit alcohol dehydrogenase family)